MQPINLNDNDDFIVKRNNKMKDHSQQRVPFPSMTSPAPSISGTANTIAKDVDPSKTKQDLDISLLKSIAQSIQDQLQPNSTILDASSVLQVLNEAGLAQSSNPLRRKLLPLFIVVDDGSGQVDAQPFFDMVNKKLIEHSNEVSGQQQQQLQRTIDTSTSNMQSTPPRTALRVAENATASTSTTFRKNDFIPQSNNAVEQPPPPPPATTSASALYSNVSSTAVGATPQPIKRTDFEISSNQNTTSAATARKPSQKEQVYTKRPQLQLAFQKFDQGIISLSKLREEVANLGIGETQSLKSLCRHRPMQFTFHEFISSLNEEPLVSDTPDPKPRFSGDRTYDSPFGTNVPINQKQAESDTPSTTAARQQRGEELRQIIYKNIRDLDLGIIGASTFEQRVKHEIDGDIPQDVTKLLAYHRASGKVNFRDFVRAFEPVIERVSKSPSKVNSNSPDKQSSQQRQLDFNDGEADSSSSTGNKLPSASFGSETASTRKFDPSDPFHALRMKPPVGGISRRPVTDHGDILSWYGANNKVEESQAIHGRQPSAKPTTSSRPFGTEVDVQQYNQSKPSTSNSAQKSKNGARPPFATEY